MAGLPKKYAKMGFKKGWRAFKQAKASSKKSHSTHKVKTHMAKKGKKKSSSKKSNKNASPSFMEKVMKKASGPAIAFGLGYVRERTSDMIAKSKLGQQLPATRFTDEATMLALSFGAKKMGLGGHWLGRKAIQTVDAQEWGRIGEEVANIQQEKKSVSTTSGTITSNW